MEYFIAIILFIFVLSLLTDSDNSGLGYIKISLDNFEEKEEMESPVKEDYESTYNSLFKDKNQIIKE